MKYKAVIFDMDGLMFDTEQLLCKMWKRAGKEKGYILDDTIFYESIGSNVTETEKIFKKAYGPDFPYRTLRKTRLLYTDEYMEKEGVPLKEGLISILALLREKGVKIAVATSTEKKRALKVIRWAGITGNFECIIGGDDVKKSKPAPDIFLKAAEQLGVRPGECIVLEDSTKGIYAALSAGMFPIMVPDLKKPTPDILKRGVTVCRDLHHAADIVQAKL